MRARDELNLVVLVELLAHVVPEEISRARGADPNPVRPRVTPKQIAHRAVVQHLLLTIDGSNQSTVVIVGERPPCAQDAVINQRRQREVIEMSVQYFHTLTEPYFR